MGKSQVELHEIVTEVETATTIATSQTISFKCDTVSCQSDFEEKRSTCIKSFCVECFGVHACVSAGGIF